jgi:hypothetical protein
MYRLFKELHGNDHADDIVWFAPSATMNPKLPAIGGGQGDGRSQHEIATVQTTSIDGSSSPAIPTSVNKAYRRA